MRPTPTSKYLEAKRVQATRAQQWRSEGRPLRWIAAKLGYSHPQSVVELIKNYGEHDDD